MCECIDKMNAQLKDVNGYLHTSSWYGMKTGNHRVTVKISVGKRDSKVRKSPPPVIPHFCPFCGEYYKSAEKKP